MEQIGFNSSADGAQSRDYDAAKEKVMSSLKDYFRPEFLNRLDDIIIFDILSEASIREIVDIQVSLVKDRLTAKEIKLEMSPEVYTFLGKEGYNPQYGARPLKRVIQNKILNPIASLMISKGVMKGGTITVGVKNEEFTFDVKKGKKGSMFVVESGVKK